MKTLARLILCLKKLPGIGPKQAERMALYLVRTPGGESEALIAALREAKAKVRPCGQCYNFTDMEICPSCSDETRDQSLLCVVEEPQAVSAIEKSRGYQGLYHVLHGRISPLDGIGPESLRVRELLERVKTNAGVLREVILATDADTEGETTALYLAQLLRPFPLKVSRLAQGVPLGGIVDYLDEKTLSHALAGRREV